ncbi:MAG: hypothetical protein ACKO7W_05385 [Elainella sp.]
MAEKFEKPLVGLLMPLGFAVSAVAMPVETEATQISPRLEDGVYLYGQSPEPATLGSEYLVFEVNQGEVIGGFYMPRSSFDCFEGKVEADRLALTVIDSYDRSPHDYAVALAASDSVASADGSTAVPLGLQGYHRLNSLGEIDQHILTTCKADLN